MKNMQKGDLFFLMVVLLLILPTSEQKLSESYIESTMNVFISIDTTWTISNSPYVFNSTVVVETGATLTIESGVTIKFEANFGMLVEGKLVALGSVGKPITFTSNSSSPSIGDWDEVSLRSSVGNILHFCIFEYANRGIAMSVSSEGTFSNCTFRYNNYGLFLSNSDGETQYSAFLDNNYGIRSESGSQFVFTYNEMAGNNQFGISTGISDRSIFQNNSIHDNGNYGIRTQSCYSQFFFNNITGNTCGGIAIHETTTSRSIDFQNNNIMNNSGYLVEILQGQDVDLSLNYWGIINETEIDELIYDYYDDPIMLGKALYQPYLNNPIKIFFSFSDEKSPNIQISNPINTSYTRQDIWLNFTVDEVSSWIGYSIDGNPNITITGNIVLTSLSEGLHSIIIYANDSAGNMGSSTPVWFTIDLTSPIVYIIAPFQTYYSDSAIFIQYGYSKTGSIQFYLNDALYPFITNESAITLSDGQYNLTIMVTDPAGNVGIATVIFTVDTIPPDGKIISPGDQYYNYEDITLIWWQEPGSSILESFIDSMSTVLTNNSIEHFIEGTHNITLVIQDPAGNIRIVTHIFEVDVTAPEVSLISPQSTTYQITDIMLSFVVNEEEEVVIVIWVYLDGELNPISNNSIIPGLTEGEHNITIEIIDAAGNKAVRTAIFSIELPKTSVTTIPTTITPVTTSPTSITTTTEETTPSVSEGFEIGIPLTILLIMVFIKRKK